MRIFRSSSEAQTERFAATFARTLRGGEILLLEGDLGAGKTAFVRGLARGLGVRDRITSPTFVLMRVHRIATSHQPPAASRRRIVRSFAVGSWQLAAVRYLVHVDAYRIRDPRELEAIGLLELAGRPDTVVAIEWGDRVRRMFHHRPYMVVRIAQRTARSSVRTIAVTVHEKTP